MSADSRVRQIMKRQAAQYRAALIEGRENGERYIVSRELYAKMTPEMKTRVICE